MMQIATISGTGLVFAALMLWSATAAPLELTGAYTASTEFVTSATRETSTRPGAMLELRLTLSETGGVLTGFLDAQVQRSILRFAFPVTGSQRSGHVELAVQVNLCLERPIVRLSGTLVSDGALQFAGTSQTITCNFSRVYLELPKSLRLVRILSP